MIFIHIDVVFVLWDIMDEDDLPDKDLPLAHVLLPPNTTTTGGCGETMQYQGGEVVVGFSLMVQMDNNQLYLELYSDNLSSKMS